MMVFEPALVKIEPGDTVKFVAADKGRNAETIKGMPPADAPWSERRRMSTRPRPFSGRQGQGGHGRPVPQASRADRPEVKPRSERSGHDGNPAQAIL
jgi:hypothetical protein